MISLQTLLPTLYELNNPNILAARPRSLRLSCVGFHRLDTFSSLRSRVGMTNPKKAETLGLRRWLIDEGDLL